MAKSKTPDRSKMNSEELRKFAFLFGQISPDLRMEFVCACITIQIAVYLIKKQQIPAQKIHKWFINEYIQEYLKLDLNINFDYANIAGQYLKTKHLIDFEKWKPILLNGINEAHRRNKEIIFATWDKYVEYMVNSGYAEKQAQKIYNWITCDKKSWY